MIQPEATRVTTMHVCTSCGQPVESHSQPATAKSIKAEGKAVQTVRSTTREKKRKSPPPLEVRRRAIRLKQLRKEKRSQSEARKVRHGAPGKLKSGKLPAVNPVVHAAQAKRAQSEPREVQSQTSSPPETGHASAAIPVAVDRAAQDRNQSVLAFSILSSMKRIIQEGFSEAMVKASEWSRRKLAREASTGRPLGNQGLMDRMVTLECRVEELELALWGDANERSASREPGRDENFRQEPQALHSSNSSSASQDMAAVPSSTKLPDLPAHPFPTTDQPPHSADSDPRPVAQDPIAPRSPAPPEAVHFEEPADTSVVLHELPQHPHEACWATDQMSQAHACTECNWRPEEPAQEASGLYAQAGHGLVEVCAADVVSALADPTDIAAEQVWPAEHTMEPGWHSPAGFQRDGLTGGPAEDDAAPKATVLLVDDDATIRMGVTMGLRAHGYACLTAENGRAAQLVLQSNRPEVIVLDLLMPVMDGLTFLQWLRNTARDSTPVLVFSNVNSPKITQEALAVGANAFACKPLHLRELVEMISQLVPN